MTFKVKRSQSHLTRTYCRVTMLPWWAGSFPSTRLRLVFFLTKQQFGGDSTEPYMEYLASVRMTWSFQQVGLNIESIREEGMDI